MKRKKVKPEPEAIEGPDPCAALMEHFHGLPEQTQVLYRARTYMALLAPLGAPDMIEELAAIGAWMETRGTIRDGSFDHEERG